MSTFCSKIHFIVFHLIWGEGGYKGRKYRFHFLLCFFFETFPKQVVCEICSLTLKLMKGLESHKKAKHSDDGTCFYCSEKIHEAPNVDIDCHCKII